MTGQRPGAGAARGAGQARHPGDQAAGVGSVCGRAACLSSMTALCRFPAVAQYGWAYSCALGLGEGEPVLLGRVGGPGGLGGVPAALEVEQVGGEGRRCRTPAHRRSRARADGGPASRERTRRRAGRSARTPCRLACPRPEKRRSNPWPAPDRRVYCSRHGGPTTAPPGRYQRSSALPPGAAGPHGRALRTTPLTSPGPAPARHRGSSLVRGFACGGADRFSVAPVAGVGTAPDRVAHHLLLCRARTRAREGVLERRDHRHRPIGPGPAFLLGDQPERDLRERETVPVDTQRVVEPRRAGRHRRSHGRCGPGPGTPSRPSSPRCRAPERRAGRRAGLRRRSPYRLNDQRLGGCCGSASSCSVTTPGFACRGLPGGCPGGPGAPGVNKPWAFPEVRGSFTLNKPSPRRPPEGSFTPEQAARPVGRRRV